MRPVFIAPEQRLHLLAQGAVGLESQLVLLAQAFFQFLAQWLGLVARCGRIAGGFSPIDWNEAVRLLVPGGGILRLGPARDHLLELRQRLYDEVREYEEDKHLAGLPDSLRLADSGHLQFSITLDQPEQLSDLLAMTPHGWRVNAERRERIISEPLTVTVAGRYDWIERI